jgi:glutamine synthetase
VDGVVRELDPGAPAEHDPARMSAEELRRSKVRPLPSSMGAALDELEKDELLLGSLGDLLGRCYLAVRRSEAEAFAAGDTGFELRQHFYKF